MTAALQVHSSEELLGESVMRLSELERSAAQFRFTAEGPQPQPSSSSSSAPPSPAQSRTAHAASATPTHPPAPQQQQQQPHTAQQPGEPRKLGADTGLPANLQNFWFPAEFSSRLPAGGIVPLELFHQRWVLFRDSAGRASCLRDTCAHRACPLSLGQVVDGAIQCPYHGWTYDGQGRCTGMPSTQFRPGVHVDALPVSEAGGFVWLWPGSEPPSDLECQAVQPPPGFQVSLPDPCGRCCHVLSCLCPEAWAPHRQPCASLFSMHLTILYTSACPVLHAPASLCTSV